MQPGNTDSLCTSCGLRACAVDGLGKPPLRVSESASIAPIRAGQVQNRLPARIFTVDIRRRGSTIPDDQVSQLSSSQFASRSGLGMNETCEEKL